MVLTGVLSALVATGFSELTWEYVHCMGGGVSTAKAAVALMDLIGLVAPWRSNTEKGGDPFPYPYSPCTRRQWDLAPPPPPTTPRTRY